MPSSVSWKRPLVVGASGQVGTLMASALQGAGCDVIRTTRGGRAGWSGMDLATLNGPADVEALLGELAPDAIFCCGAMTYVDGCEVHPQQAFRANAHGPSALASYARFQGVPFAFFSSDYVFAGTPGAPGPYVESDAAQPLSVYGQSKLQGERAVLRVHPEALVVRTSWVYGPDAEGKNFISSLLRQLRAGQVVRVPSDQISTPTLNLDLSRLTLELLKAGATGVVHVTGQELLSRYDLALRVAKRFGLSAALIEGVATAELGQRASRPLQSGLRSERLDSLLPGVTLHTLDEGLAEAAVTLGAPADRRPRAS